jgi:cellulose synthase/poly-beta-1,6-N-acetylglucosamine synthase-like glycosyltransferase
MTTQSLCEDIFEPALASYERRTLRLLVFFWLAGTLVFWRWALQPSVWVSMTGTLINLILLFYVTGISLWPFYLFLRMRQVRPDLSEPEGLRVAMVVTKAPSEPWSLVQATLLAMLAQCPPHDNWLADEQPSEEVLAWCDCYGVKLSTREGIEAYNRQTWPRRTRCKEGNLAYFYDHYGYLDYDVVVQLDADHVPQPGYLTAMLQPFHDPRIGYVAAPSICNANESSSWIARGRLFAEAALHGPMQMGFNGVWAPLCIGSHYAVRTKALQQAGGLGPELAEDHSTTLLMNANGWRGAFANRAICFGLGPETFEDAMVQEFQWSRSLTTILLHHLPPVIRQLEPNLRLQFFYAQVYYPLRGILSLAALALPVLALVLDRPWMEIHYPTFLAFSGLQMLLTVLPVLYVRSCGLLRPSSAPLLSWEQTLFELTRGPWILAGVFRAVEEWIWPRPITFRITRKQTVSSPLPLRFLLPYVGAVLIGVAAAFFLGDSARYARGYVFLTLITTAMFAISGLAIALLSHFESAKNLRSHLYHYGLTGVALLLTLFCFWWRLPELMVPFQQTPASALLMFNP